jgi:phosphoglycerate dehydrogenase-like enzyme
LTLPFEGFGRKWRRHHFLEGVSNMKDIVIVGAGKIGSMIAELLGGSATMR